MLLTETNSLCYYWNWKCLWRCLQRKRIVWFQQILKGIKKYYDNLDSLMVGKMKDEPCGVPIKDVLD